MSKRLTKKYFKRVADGQRMGRETPFFYISKTRSLCADFIDSRYITVFRPWWYDQDWSKYKLQDEMNRHYEESVRILEEKWGIDLKRLADDYNNGKRKQARKPRKDKKTPPIRRLRNPEKFMIGMRDGSKQEVEGEIAFEYLGHKFFIYLSESVWRVCSVIGGLQVSIASNYKDAVRVARGRITDRFESYVKTIERLGEEKPS